MIKVGELKQNSEEWHKWRQEGIGASEANIIMGVSKFMTPFQLWEQKVYGKRAEEKTGNFITDKGHRLEAKARPLFEMEIGHDFPDTIAIHSKFEFLRASLDGFCEDINAVWECKFVGQDDFEKVKNGEILEQYFPQLQHQLMVTGAKVNYLYVIADDKTMIETDFPYKTAFVEVYPDLDYMKERLVPSLMDFWDKVQTKTQPEFTRNDVIDYSDNKELLHLLMEYKETKGKLDEITKREKSIKSQIFKITKEAKAICQGIKITNSKSPDSIGFDYKKFEEENGIPEGFDKIVKGRKTQRITFPKSDQ
jgi:putative phage-type endonuclease